ncbi:phosphatase PAP2 family protein [Methanotorris igneus]|uniref:Phosphoesterase PA-phosphatase related protein n=1 Tax=Methanotorris igneus (strain DSM 5666 / JCM 11834 / Kol 5) TaxID=880724 RepID=F6BCW8_METIK|nr:phosphatase PAP2 family protein [Methanotorris igneus]AEF96329.1 phosphoesterase PA-phosphatase related protein [Methanotorris igneus Kol 5]
MDLYAIAEYLVHNYGYLGIFLVAFTEAFIQPVPPDIFIMGASLFGLNPLISALTATIGSLFGGLFGYFLGNKLGHPAFIKLFGDKYLIKGEEFFNKYGFWGVALAGFTPIPYKVIAWLAGIFEMSKFPFSIGTFVGRLPRFLAVAYFGNILVSFDYTALIETLNKINIQLFYTINSHYNVFLDMTMTIITHSAYPMAITVLVLSFLKDRNFGNKVLIALTLAFLVAFSLKYIINEPRPYLILKNIHLLSYEGYEPSFPSGHTTFAFTVSTLLYSYSKKMGLIFLIWAILVGYSRVYVGVHYPFDVLAGAIIGIVCGYLVVNKKIEKLLKLLGKYSNLR